MVLEEKGAIKLVRYAVTPNPINDPAITRQLAIFVMAKNIAPMIINNLLVSPIEPGIQPTNIFHQE